MEKLAEGYEAVNKDVTVEVQQSDSTTGVNMAAEGTVDIGMASRDLKDEEKDLGLTATVIARDGIAVIVNKDNDVDELTSDQVKLYTQARLLHGKTLLNNMIISGYKGQKAVRACTTRRLNLGPAKH